MTLSDEKIVQNYYDSYWSLLMQRYQIDERYAIHHGFFTRVTTTHREAIQNMNIFVETLLEPNKYDEKTYLDIGCGIGSTGIYLAKKYPKNHFLGITISPLEVELAKTIANKGNIVNTQFFLGNFLNTGFDDNTIDGAFALESINHSHNKINLVRELSRILKTGGKLVVLDWFRSKTPHSLMQKIYDAWRMGQANITLESCDNFISCLKDAGFGQIQVRNLFSNIKQDYSYTFLIWFPMFISKLSQKMLGIRKEGSSEEMKYYLSLSCLDIFIGRAKIAEYLAITAVKK